ncbi:MAG: FMNH2-dependent monooxygenase, partial [Rhodococcus erythropolis]|nr:FMNH2-dependent monooxygenase [Rhodococcus erythropolis]
MADRRRPLKTVTGVSGAVSIYDAAIDPTTSTVTSAIDVAKTAEANKIDGLFAADLLSFGAQGAIGAQEPLIFLAALSAVTTHVGLIATVTTTFHHPFNLARLFGTLDHVSNGRAAWNAVTSSLGEENYSDLDLPSPEERYARAAESLEVVNALFDSWKPGALTRGEGSAVLDPSRVVPIEHRGKYFTVQGPLNIPSLPQRRPVQFQAGQSAGGIELGARFAEVVFTSLATFEDAVTYTKT